MANRASRRRGRRAAPAALALGVLLLGLAPLASAADGDLVVSQPSPLPGGGLSITVTVPRALSTRALEPGSLTAEQSGQPVAVATERVVDGPFEVVLALDVTGGALALAEEQAAAADLLRALPPTTRTTVLPGGSTGTAAEALSLVEQTVPGTAGLLDGLSTTTSSRRAVVVLTGCPALSEEDRPAADGTGTTVSVLVREVDCRAAAARVAGGDPGVVRTGLDAPGLLAAADDVTRSLLGRYAVTLGGPLTPEPVDLVLAAVPGPASARVLPPQGIGGPSAPAAPQPSPISRSRSRAPRRGPGRRRGPRTGRASAAGCSGSRRCWRWPRSRTSSSGCAGAPPAARRAEPRQTSGRSMVTAVPAADGSTRTCPTTPMSTDPRPRSMAARRSRQPP